MKKYKLIIIGLLLLIFGAISFYFGGFLNILFFMLSITIYTIIFYLITYTWKKLGKKQLPHIKVFILNFLYRILLTVAIFLTLGTVYCYYINTISPASLKQFTLSNGNKTVIFQSMIHIGRNGFYENIKQELIQAKKDGYVYFFEGVRPGNKENMQLFNDALGIEFSPDIYKNISQLYGLTFQNHELFMNQVNNKDFNIDVSIDEIMAQYQENISKKDIQTTHKPATDVNTEVIQILSEMNSKELQVIQYINKAILNSLFKSNLDLDSLGGVNDEELFDIILHERNKVVAQEITTSKYDKFFITYGALHFEGILQELHKSDPNWKIISEKEFYPISEKK